MSRTVAAVTVAAAAVERTRRMLASRGLTLTSYHLAAVPLRAPALHFCGAGCLKQIKDKKQKAWEEVGRDPPPCHSTLVFPASIPRLLPCTHLLCVRVQVADPPFAHRWCLRRDTRGSTGRERGGAP